MEPRCGFRAEYQAAACSYDLQAHGVRGGQTVFRQAFPWFVLLSAASAAGILWSCASMPKAVVIFSQDLGQRHAMLRRYELRARLARSERQSLAGDLYPLYEGGVRRRLASNQRSAGPHRFKLKADC